MKYLTLSNKKSFWKKIKNPNFKARKEQVVFGFKSEK